MQLKNITLEDGSYKNLQSIMQYTHLSDEEVLNHLLADVETDILDRSEHVKDRFASALVNLESLSSNLKLVETQLAVCKQGQIPPQKITDATLTRCKRDFKNVLNDCIVGLSAVVEEQQ